MASIEVERNMPRLPRIINSGVDYSDLQRVLIAATTTTNTGARSGKRSPPMHEAIGDEALRDGRTITAGEAFHRAAVCFHMAQATKHHDLPWKEAAAAAPARRLPQGDAVSAAGGAGGQVPYKGKSFPGYLRLPEDAPRPVPCVILLAGLDFDQGGDRHQRERTSSSAASRPSASTARDRASRASTFRWCRTSNGRSARSSIICPSAPISIRSLRDLGPQRRRPHRAARRRLRFAAQSLRIDRRLLRMAVGPLPQGIARGVRDGHARAEHRRRREGRALVHAGRADAEGEMPAADRAQPGRHGLRLSGRRAHGARGRRPGAADAVSRTATTSATTSRTRCGR